MSDRATALSPSQPSSPIPTTDSHLCIFSEHRSTDLGHHLLIEASPSNFSHQLQSNEVNRPKVLSQNLMIRGRKAHMSIKEMVMQEIEKASEPLLERVLELIYGWKDNQDPLIVHLNRLREQNDYADDVMDEALDSSDASYRNYLEGKDRGIGLDDLERELFGKNS
jgi:hypothetical protein